MEKDHLLKLYFTLNIYNLETFLPVKCPPHEGTGILSKTTGLYSVVVVVARCVYSSMRSCSAKSLGNRLWEPTVSSMAYQTHKNQKKKPLYRTYNRVRIEKS